MYDENSNASAATATVSSASAIPGSAIGGGNQSTLVTQILNAKDSRWLQVEVCREFQRGQCTRSDQECKFAHPPPHVDVQQGRVTACYDSIKARCTRENPKCKYLHPPQHIKDQLLINGRNNLAIRNLLCSQFQPSSQPLAAAPVNPLAQIIAAQQQATQGLTTANMMPLAYPYYQQLVYPQLLDPYQQQLQPTAGQQQLQQHQQQQQHQQNALAIAVLLQQQQQQQALAVAQQQALLASGSRKRPLDDEPSVDATTAALQLNLQSAGVPVKRAAIDKAGGAGQTAAGAMLFQQTGQNGAQGQQYSGYMPVLPGIPGYVPTVNFNGQAGGIPPRF
ncbi:unnamed protein product, partial [Mesorhabditis spiculigera]